MKTLSIIVPLYNSERFLPKCLESLLEQDIPKEEYEIILVDDGSPDGSRKIAEDYASRNSNIIVLSQPNKGTSGARNTGLRRAIGKYVYFVDPDDYVLKNSIACLLQKMEEDELDVLRFGYTEVDEQYQPTKSCKSPESPDYSSRVMDGCTFMAERLGVACYVWTFLFRRSLLTDNEIFFYEGDYFDDTPWLPRVLSVAHRVDSIDFKRHYYLIRKDSLVQSSSKKSISKKIDGLLFMVKELLQQDRASENESASRWYHRMISHCVLTLLTLVGESDFDKRKDYIEELKGCKVFPLATVKSSMTNRVKISLVNSKPEFYCWLIHIKRRLR